MKSTRYSMVAVAALSGTMLSSAAYADCVAGAGALSTLVTCDSPGGVGTGGYNTTTSGVTIQVAGTAVVNTPPTAGAPLLSAGANSAVNNFSGDFNGTQHVGIQAGNTTDSPAITLGGGSTVTNASNGYIQGAITFGSTASASTTNASTGGTAVNTLNNNYSANGGPADIDGNITSQGNTVINNQGVINDAGYSTITQTGAGTVTINNGVAGGFANVTEESNYTNSTIYADINTVGSTTVNNLAGASIYYSETGMTLGTGGAGTTTVNNDGLIDGPVTLSDKTNVIVNTGAANLGQSDGDVTLNGVTNTVTNDGVITGNVTFNGTGTNTYNAGSVGSSGDNGLRLPGYDGEATVAGTLQGSLASGAVNVLNLNGTGVSTLQTGSTIKDFQTVNMNDTGTWVVKATLDGDPGVLTAVNVGSGTLSLDNAAFLGTSATKVTNDGDIIFNGTSAGTFAGNISGTGYVEVTGTGVTTLTGTNTYTFYTFVHGGGTLDVNSAGALPAVADVYLGGRDGNGTLNINAAASVNNLYDNIAVGETVNHVNISSGNSLTVQSGNFGNVGGTIGGAGTLIKAGTGTFYLYGENLTTVANLVINDGTVNDEAGSIGDGTAVQVNSAPAVAATTGANATPAVPATTGVLDIATNDTIGSLGGTGTAAQVVLSEGATLTTGVLNTDSAFAGQISGAGALAKTGSGTMILTGFNTYSGGTTVENGLLVGYAGTTAANSSLQGNIAVADGATVVFDQTLNGASALPPVLSSAHASSGESIITPGTDTSGTYAGSLSGAGSATFYGDGVGVLTLAGNNSALTGTMNFFDGSVVAIGAANNLGTGTLNFDGGTLENTASVTLANAITINEGGATYKTDPATTLELDGGITGSGSLTKTGTGTLILTGSNSYSGGTTVSAGVLQGTAGTSLQGNIVDNAQVNFTGNFQTYSGNISGTGSVELLGNSGNGNFAYFNGTNTYSGATTIDAGAELVAYSTGALSAASAYTVNGTLYAEGDFSNTNASTIGSLAGSGTVYLFNETLNIGADNTSTTFSGALVGFDGPEGGNVTKIGTGTLTLSGTNNAVGGLLDVNGGTLALTGSLSADTAQVDTGATLFVDGTLTLTNPTTPNLTINAGGLLKGGVGIVPGTINGNVINNGTVQPGHSPGILNINGNYTQGATGTLIVNVNAAASTPVAGINYGQLNVSGTATLAGNLTVIATGGMYKAGTVYHIITAAGGFTGAFTTVTGLPLSAFLSLTNTGATGGVQGDDYDLVVTRAAYNTAAINPNQVGVANGLQGLLADTTTTGTTDRIDNMTTAQAQALFNQASPEAYGAYATALQDQAELFTHQVASRIAGNVPSHRGVWGNLYGQWSKGKDDDYRFGSNQNTTGGAVGIDTKVGAITLGVAGGYSEDKVTYRPGTSSGKSKLWQAGAYAAYEANKVEADAIFAYTGGNIDVTKTLNAGSGTTLVNGTSLAYTNAHAFKGVATVGYNFGADDLHIVPYVGVDVLSGHVNGFSENGLGVLDLTVDQISANRTDVLGGIRVAALTGMIRPYLNATYRYVASGANNRVINGYFNGNTADAVSVNAIAASRSQGEVDAGLSANLAPNASVRVSYHGIYSGDATSHGANVGFTFGF